MDEATFHASACWTQIALAFVTVLALLRVRAPYGRHTRAGWGPTIPARIAWITMEMPAVLFFAWVFTWGPAPGVARASLEGVPLALAALWLLHYVHRTLVFPFRLRAEGKTMPLAIAALAFSFQLLNSYINARAIAHFTIYPASWWTDPRFVTGVICFSVGLAINLHADTVLLRLRAPGEDGYKIPRGGLYRYISCPNYLGEILEWIGWALATWSLAGLAFALYTIANVGPRAFAHHRWYREHFPDYPKERRALLPFLA